MSAFDREFPSWSVARRRRQQGGLWVYSVIERAGGSRYWFGPFKQGEIEAFVESRRKKFEQMPRFRSNRVAGQSPATATAL